MRLPHLVLCALIALLFACIPTTESASDPSGSKAETPPAKNHPTVSIPFSGTFAKIFSEMIDESPRDAAEALGAAGASPIKVYLFGLVPRALPDILAYILYRFECALRASAVIGFFGIATLGFYIANAFEDLRYSLVWTYLYALIIMVVIFDLWSGSARRRIAHQ